MGIWILLSIANPKISTILEYTFFIKSKAISLIPNLTHQSFAALVGMEHVIGLIYSIKTGF
ncbi:hypothetical protein AHAS_Ahas04G0195800 [Arachis hypogaea]